MKQIPNKVLIVNCMKKQGHWHTSDYLPTVLDMYIYLIFIIA